ncbi:GGDEF domain-containing protein [Clostridium sp. DL1XJH146]
MNNNKVLLNSTIIKLISFAILVPLLFFASDYTAETKKLIIIVVLLGIYYLVSSIFIYKSFPIKKYFIKLLPYTDILFVTYLIILRGGLRSDVYIIYIGLINFYTLISSKLTIILIFIFSMLGYIFASIFYTPNDLYSTGRLIIRLVYIAIVFSINFSIKNFYVSTNNDLILEKANARRDPLTNLWNRLMLNDLIENFDINTSYGLILLDIDNFKSINDTYGHQFGDKVIISVSQHIVSFTGCQNYCFRLGGDEFLIMLLDKDEENFISYIGKAKHYLSSTKVRYNSQIKNIHLSIGSAYCINNDFDKYISIVDKEMYKNKAYNKNKSCNKKKSSKNETL